MRLKAEYLTQAIGDEYLLIPTADATNQSLLRANRTFGEVLELLKTESTEEQIVDALCERFDAPRDRISQGVESVIEALRAYGALQE